VETGRFVPIQLYKSKEWVEVEKHVGNISPVVLAKDDMEWAVNLAEVERLHFDKSPLAPNVSKEQLAERPDEQAATQAHHARYYLTYFSSTDERLRSSVQGEVLAELTAETKSTFVALEALVGIARLSASQGKIEQALELSLIVLNHPASLQETKEHAERLYAKLTERFDPQTVEIAHDACASQRFDKIVEAMLASNL